VMLNSIALKSFRAPIIHVHRQRDSDGALGKHEPFAVVLINAQVIGDDLKLIAGHPKNVVLVNMHEAERESYTTRGKERLYLRTNQRASN
jgi:hypothetical protein